MPGSATDFCKHFSYSETQKSVEYEDDCTTLNNLMFMNHSIVQCTHYTDLFQSFISVFCV